MPPTIMLLPGDGIGPEVVAEAVKVLKAAARRFDHSLNFDEGVIGGCAIDAHGTALPDETLDRCRTADAVLLGAVGGPKWSDPAAAVRPEQGLLRIRKELGLFANLRPVRVTPALAAASPLRAEIVRDVNLVVVRELTGGIYFGESGRTTHAGEEAAFDTMFYAVSEIERVTRVAACLAQQRSGRLTSIDKANVLESSRLWRSTVTRVIRDEFPDVTLDHILVDAAAMFLIKQPSRFDVLVTENMFGDILTDEASVIAGSLGLLPSASLGAGTDGLYEPIHGSAPDIAGQSKANPVGTILSAAMACRYSLNWEPAAALIEAAVAHVLATGIGTADIVTRQHAVTTTVLGDHIADAVATLDIPTEEPTCART